MSPDFDFWDNEDERSEVRFGCADLRVIKRNSVQSWVCGRSDSFGRPCAGWACIQREGSE